MKILLISGHGAGDSGAVGCGYKEADLTRTATYILEGKLEAYDLTVDRYPTARNAYEDNKAGNLARSFKSYDLVIEVHFNSYNGSAHGTEVLYRADNCKTIAKRVSAAIASFGFTDRGAKYRSDLMNMNTCLRQGVPYILIETCFIDSASDMKLYKTDLYSIWANVAASICSYYGVKTLASAGKSVASSKTTTTTQTTAKSTKKGYTGTFPSLGTKGYLSYGDRGTNVKRMQAFLNWYGGYGLALDGSFGPATLRAVKAYQKSEKLEVDGYFGPASLKRAKSIKK